MDQHSIGSSALESRVLIIMTGGTICMKKSPNGFVPARGFLESGMAPRPSFNDFSNPDDIVVVVDDGTEVSHRSLRTPISTYQKHVRYAVFEFQELLDSSSISSEGWSQIAQTIFRNYKLFDAFVILHGTDSLAYTCSALSFMLQNLGKPVILTGSQAPMLELQNDATDNLLGSLIIAGHFMIPEVCLFFNYNLFRGNRTTKVSASDFSAFASPNAPPLGTISSLKTHVKWELIHRPTHLEPFSIQTNRATADVACLRIFPGIEPRMVEAVLQLDGLKGLVLETFGAGNAPGGPDGALTKVFANAIRRGIIIVNITQCMTGTVSPLYEPAMLLKHAGVIPGHDMTSEAALAKLSYLLAMPGLNPEDIVQKMSVSLRGEMTEQVNMVFEHPSGVLPDRLARLTSLGYAISKGDVPEIQKLLKGDHGWLLNEADYSGNTPLHIAATGPSLEILRILLTKGASVHLRNNTGRTPLFASANAGLMEHVSLLKRSGAHVHADELSMARLLAQSSPDVWSMVGVA
ncbi:hypothetical protein HO133_005505 [Letharia lupina]|uniref:asparaginase n=2 Tax=Letharia TaxID=112415 RepID=A0A8H6F8K1_9LECA|nr:uncharacterized protein HO133_005505 [Letharia lupina]KAF6218961.1 hypothetical protein HO133_005505 [Letharia lupina]